MPTPGEIRAAPGHLTINEGLETTAVQVRNDSANVVYVTSHYHFFEANRFLVFDRRAAYGMRLDVSAGTGVRWAQGETKEVALVPLAGRREVYGFHGFVNGPLDGSLDAPEGGAGVDAALKRLRAAGFADTGADAADSRKGSR